MDDDPQPSANGFIPLRTFKRWALRVGLEAALARHGSVPLLVAAGAPELPGTPRARSPSHSGRTVYVGGDMPTPAGHAHAYHAHLAPLRKRPGNPFPQMVTVGRASSCDLVLLLPTISKIHAYFLVQDGRWALADQRSLNRTFVNGEELTFGTKQPLTSGDRIRFGQELEFCLFEPDELLPRLVASTTTAAGLAGR